MAIPAGRKEPQARSLASLSKSLIRKGSDRTGLSDRRNPVLAGKLVPSPGEGATTCVFPSPRRGSAKPNASYLSPYVRARQWRGRPRLSRTRS